MTSHSSLRLAVDIGGTFTDTVLTDSQNNILSTTKTPTTPDNPTRGALAGVQHVMRQSGSSLPDVTGFVHGTTLATNALIERKGATVASITTKGFRDILEIAYERRYSQYDINLQKPDLIVPRDYSLTIGERMSAAGAVLEPLNLSDIDLIVAQLDTLNVQAVAICLLHSYANPAHEQQLADQLRQRRPDLILSLSSSISQEAREFERLCTTIANAYIQPAMNAYLTDFSRAFKSEGLNCPILMMTAGGGMTSIETAARHPIRLVESGPAGGAILAAEIAARAKLDAVISFDMGGTTAKLCLIDDYKPQTARKFEIARAARFIKGSGMPVRIPVLEMIEIGAGGGSIASVDTLGRLKVGPQSAGSEPGPATFAKGGTEATVTDADVALGLIPPGPFAEGRLLIDATLANTALLENVGIPLALNAAEAAMGLSEIVDESMASAGRTHAVESGKDLGTRTMIAFGGNGPLHATRVARRAGVQQILIPPDPGVGSAVGFLFAPVSFEIVRSRYATLDTLEPDVLNDFFATMISEASEIVAMGAPGSERITQRRAFMRYHGQGHEIEIRLPDRALERADIAGLQSAFEAEYSRQFSRAVPGMTIEILNWAVTVSTLQMSAPRPAKEPKSQPAVVAKSRKIICDVTGQVVSAAIFARENLRPGDILAGPALIVEPQTTTLLSADFTGVVDGVGNLILTRIDRTGARS